jgi:hypothetical protein
MVSLEYKLISGQKDLSFKKNEFRTSSCISSSLATDLWGSIMSSGMWFHPGSGVVKISPFLGQVKLAYEFV